MAILFHNETVTLIQTAAESLLCGANMIPSARIVPLIPQLTARLCDPTVVPQTIELQTIETVKQLTDNHLMVTVLMWLSGVLRIKS